MVPGHMVGLIVIVVIICAISGAVAYGAWKGSFRGLGNALQTSSRSGSRTLNSVLAMVFIGGAIVVPAVFIIGNRDNSDAQVGGIKMTAPEQAGRELFAEHCAVCHTLAADNAVGKTGPNLDVLRPSEAIVLKTIANGCLQQPTAASTGSTCLGYGTMPADIVEGRQAQDIAAFVARIAGHT
jgi:mono/diheme cytochrome c family protein